MLIPNPLFLHNFVFPLFTFRMFDFFSSVSSSLSLFDSSFIFITFVGELQRNISDFPQSIISIILLQLCSLLGNYFIAYLVIFDLDFFYILPKVPVCFFLSKDKTWTNFFLGTEIIAIVENFYFYSAFHESFFSHEWLTLLTSCQN